jgi:Family of unknown function (DUF5683)
MNMSLKYLALTSSIILCLWACSLQAQVPDSVQAPIPSMPLDSLIRAATTIAVDSLPSDTLRIDSMERVGPVRRYVFRPVGRFFRSDYPNPRKAALLGLVIPGGGQAYNQKWWKIPIVYAALGGVGYVQYNNVTQFRYYRDNYIFRVDGDSLTISDPRLIRLDDRTLKANRDIARQNLEYSSVILGLTVLLSVTDAFVDAHMRNFDVSDDLSLQFRPKIQDAVPGGPAFGIGIALQIR